MEHILPLIFILFFEYLGDFVFQSREIANNKSVDDRVLQKHLLILSSWLFVPVVIVLSQKYGAIWGVTFSFAFCSGNALIHGVIDWNIWKIYKWIVFKRIKKQNPSSIECALKEFKDDRLYADDPVFYNIIGLDRLLHVSTIIFLYFVFV